MPAGELRKVRAYVAKLARMLAPEWKVTVAEFYTTEDAQAVVYPTPKIRDAVIVLGSDWDNIETDAEAGYTLLHELLHLVTAEMCASVQGTYTHLEKQACSIAWACFDTLEEVAVHKLALALAPVMPKFGGNK